MEGEMRQQGMVGSSKVYLQWAVGVGGVALVLGLCTSVVLVLALRGLLPMSPWLWVVARCLVIVEVVCLVTSVVLMAMGLSGRFRKWIASGVRRCVQWGRGLF